MELSQDIWDKVIHVLLLSKSGNIALSKLRTTSKYFAERVDNSTHSVVEERGTNLSKKITKLIRRGQFIKVKNILKNTSLTYPESALINYLACCDDIYSIRFVYDIIHEDAKYRYLEYIIEYHPISPIYEWATCRIEEIPARDKCRNLNCAENHIKFHPNVFIRSCNECVKYKNVDIFSDLFEKTINLLRDRKGNFSYVAEHKKQSAVIGSAHQGNIEILELFCNEEYTNRLGLGDSSYLWDAAETAAKHDKVEVLRWILDGRYEFTISDYYVCITAALTNDCTESLDLLMKSFETNHKWSELIRECVMGGRDATHINFMRKRGNFSRSEVLSIICKACTELLGGHCIVDTGDMMRGDEICENCGHIEPDHVIF